jgi:hypothetical protein
MTDVTELARLKARVGMLEYVIRVNGLRAGCSPQEAARIIVDEVLHKPCHEAVKLRGAMYDATLKTKATALTRTVRWSVVNDALEALAAYKSDGADE